MKSWKVILATLIIFCSGLVTGALMMHFFRPHHPYHSSQLPPQNPSGHRGNQPAWHQKQRAFLSKIDNDLHLTPEQHNRIENLLKESQERTKQIRDKIAPELKSELKRVHEQIREELNPDQREKFEEAVKNKFPRKNSLEENPHQQSTNSSNPGPVQQD